MLREFMILFVLAHVVGDFYLQTSSMVAKKKKSLIWLLFHDLMYWVGVTLVLLSVLSVDVFLMGVIAAVFHAGIDSAKWLYIKFKKKKWPLTPISKTSIFLIDQFLHGLSLVLLVWWALTKGVLLEPIVPVREFLNIVGADPRLVLYGTAAILIIHKPANILISQVLAKYKPSEKEKGAKKDINAGRFIGSLERMIMLIFLCIGQYAALGLVLTAKSIARYDKISKKKDFAEYYLLGTLMSTLVVILVSFMF